MTTIVFTFGRFNPPTKGHEKVVRAVVETAKTLSADHEIYLSQTCKPLTDPLEWNFKRRVCESAFKGIKISHDQDIRTPFQALEHLAENYNKIVLVVGSDQVPEFNERMAPYAEKMGLDFTIVSAGDRIDESEDVAGISATKMRQYAISGDKKKFYAGLPSTLKEAAKELIYKNTLKGLKLPNK